MTTSTRRQSAAMAPFTQRNFTLVWCAGLISLTGDYAIRVALSIAVFQLTGSVAATSGVVIATVLPALLGPIAGVFVDRWCRRKVLLVAGLLQAVVLLPLVAVSAETIWIVYVVAFAASTLSQFVTPAENALLPALVDDENLAAANSLNAVNNNLARLVGPALGGGLAAWSGLSAVVLVDAASFVVAAGLVALVRGRFAAHQVEPDVQRHPVAAIGHELADGLRAIRNNRLVLVLVVVFTGTSIGEGIMSALMPVFVQDYLHGGSVEYGWLMSAQAVGGIAGGFVGSWIAGRFTPVRLLSVGCVIFGFVDLALFGYPWIAPVLWPGLLFFALAGIPAVIVSGTLMTLVQAELPDAVRGRVFAALGTSMGLATLLGASLCGAFAEQVGALTLLILQGSGYVVAGVAIAWLLDRRASAPAAPVAPPAQPAPAERLALAGSSTE